MKNCLIIGANSFLAKELVKQLAKLAITVDGVFHKTTPTNENFSKLVPIEKLHTLASNYDVVFLLASFIPYGNMDTPNYQFITTNIDLVSDVVKRFVSSRIIFASSIAVYGLPITENPIQEHTPFNNPSLYGLSKLAGEAIIKNHHNYAIIRFSSLYGIGMSTSTFIPQIIQKAIKERNITLFGNGERQQDYFHVTDAAKLCIAAAKYAKNDVFLGISGYSLSNKEVANSIKNCIGNVDITFQGVDTSPSFQYINEYTRKTLKFEPEKDFKEALNQLIVYAKTI